MFDILPFFKLGDEIAKIKCIKFIKKFTMYKKIWIRDIASKILLFKIKNGNQIIITL